MKLAVVIPCYNEKDNIPLIVQRIRETFSREQGIEVILVDNGSTDGSTEVFEAAVQDLDILRLIKVDKNQGYGHGILTGLIAASEADVLAWTHADMQTDPKDVLTAYELFCKQNAESCIVKGKRRNRAFLDTLFSFVMQVIASLALGVKLDDVNAQPKVISRQFFERHILGKAPKDFSLDLFLLYQAAKTDLAILSVPVIFKKRQYGEAKGGGGSNWRTRKKLIFRTLSYINEVRRSVKHKVS